MKTKPSPLLSLCLALVVVAAAPLQLRAQPGTDSLSGWYLNPNTGHMLTVQLQQRPRAAYIVRELLPGTRDFRSPFGEGAFGEMHRRGQRHTPNGVTIWVEGADADNNAFRATFAWNGTSLRPTLSFSALTPSGEVAAEYMPIAAPTGTARQAMLQCIEPGTYLLADSSEALVFRRTADSLEHTLWLSPTLAGNRRGPGGGRYVPADTVVWDVTGMSFRVRYAGVGWGLRGWWVPEREGLPAEVVLERETDGEKYVFVRKATDATWPDNAFLSRVAFAQVAAAPQPQYPVVRKPILYLHSTTEREVTVRLGVPNTPQRVCYPALDSANSWQVRVLPSGGLSLRGSQRAYPSLFWEAPLNVQLPEAETANGWLVERADVVPFLEARLHELNFSAAERAEFIQYWMPELIRHELVFIHFAFVHTAAGRTQQNESGAVYARLAPVAVSPAPEHLLRVLMLWEPCEPGTALKRIQPQTLPRLERAGFYALEWGGARLPSR